MNTRYKSFNQLMVEMFMAKMHAHPAGREKQPLPACPTAPSVEVRKLRARLMLEETLETIRDGLGLDVIFETPDVHCDITMENVRFNEMRIPNLIEVADGLADQEVVLLGTAAVCGIAHQPIFELVMDNNLLKFAPGHRFDEGGKLIKPPTHPKPTSGIAGTLVTQGWRDSTSFEEITRQEKELEK